jgi:hypothetical protein
LTLLEASPRLERTPAHIFNILELSIELSRFCTP